MLSADWKMFLAEGGRVLESETLRPSDPVPIGDANGLDWNFRCANDSGGALQMIRIRIFEVPGWLGRHLNQINRDRARV